MFGKLARSGAWALLFALAPEAAFAQLEAAGGERLDVRLQIPEGKTPAFKGSEPILIDFVLSNTSASAVRVLVWRTPFNGVTDNIFAVAAGRSGPATVAAGGSVSYIGPIVKRGPPLPEDFITLAPGETRKETVNLADYYAIYQPSNYSVTYRPSQPSTPALAPQGAVPAGTPTPPGPLRKVAVQSNALTFAVTEAREPALIALAAPPAGPGPSFDSCSASQQTDLRIAIPAAANLAAGATKVLKDTPSAQQPMAERYKTWFGAHSTQRYNTVTSHYEGIQNALSTKHIEIGCAGNRCSGSTYAYVFPTQPYKIFVCQAFWNAHLQGTDSRAGTLVHETSHFDVVAGTDDVVYGQSGAQDLAASNPDAATTNADSHEYFSENTPNLPM